MPWPVSWVWSWKKIIWLWTGTMHTNIPGVFAAGDCIGGLNQVATAVGEGAIAGMEALKFIRAQAQHK
jgi:thioredoxin reductase